MIVAKTRMEKIPDNCWACEYYGCNLPFKVRQPDLLKQAYKNKRHKDCPLVEVSSREDSKARG